MKKTLFAILFLTITATLLAAPLRNVPQTLIQPNGDTLHCLASGDEFFNYLHDANGYTIIQHPVTGYYVYAERDGENIKASNYIAGKVNPVLLGLEKDVLPAGNRIREIATAKRQAMGVDRLVSRAAAENAPDAAKNHGVLNNIVVFIRFNDDADTPFSSLDTYDVICNAPNTSMKAYFEEVSYGKISIPSTYYPAPNGQVVQSYKDANPRSYYQPYNVATNPNGYKNETVRGQREQTLVKNAVESISIPTSLNIDMNDDGRVDNVSIIVSGTNGEWNDLLWPHRWSMWDNYAKASINGKKVVDYIFIPDNGFNVSTLCHETFHALGAPDLYHYNSPYNSLSPVFKWDIMESNATPPQHMSAYMKYKYGNWISDIPTITTPGVYTLSPVNTSETNNCYKIPIQGSSNEFYVLEYRKKTDRGEFESSIQGSGLLIYRINTNFDGNAQYNGVNVFDEVYVFRPNGTPTTNGSPALAHFSSTVGRTVFNSTTNPYPFFTNGTRDIRNISISEVSAAGDVISFKYEFVELDSIQITTDSTIIIERNNPLSAKVFPSNATIQTLTWSVVNGTGTAHISGNNLIGDAVGKVLLKAVSQDGSGVSASKEITIKTIPVTGIDITMDSVIPISNEQVPLVASVSPADAVNKTLAWSVTNGTGMAHISENNLILDAAGTITLKATAQDGSGIVATKEIEIIEIPVTELKIAMDSVFPITTKNVPLKVQITPQNTTTKTLVWSVTNESGLASIVDNMLMFDRVGYVTLTVKAQDSFEATDALRIFITDGISDNPVKTYWIGTGADGNLTVENPEGIALLEIYSLSGSKMRETRGSKSTMSMQVPFADLPCGIYVLRVWNGNKTKVSTVKIMW